MSNKQRGQVSFLAGEDKYTLHLSTNAMCELEDAFDTDIQSVFEKLDPEQTGKPVRLTTMRLVIKAMLRDNHSELTTEKVGEIIDEYGLNDILSRVGEAAQLAFPDAESVDSAGGKPKAVATG